MFQIFPAIDMRNGCCVRLFQGDYNKETVYGKDPAFQASLWEEAGAPLIHLVDLDGAKEGHPVNCDAIEKICKKVSIPCEIGGGIRTLKDAELLFSLGIARIILGTAACEDPALAKEFISAFGAEKVVIGIDQLEIFSGGVFDSGIDAGAVSAVLFIDDFDDAGIFFLVLLCDFESVIL